MWLNMDYSVQTANDLDPNRLILNPLPSIPNHRLWDLHVHSHTKAALACVSSLRITTKQKVQVPMGTQDNSPGLEEEALYSSSKLS